MQHRPCRHVQHEKDGGGEIVDQEHVHHGKGEGDADDTYQSLTLRHAQGYELVVDMIPVRQEKGLPAPPTVQYDPHHIKHRHDQEREGSHDSTGKDAFLHRIGHAQANGHHRQQHSDGERAGVAHEDLASAAYLAEYVIIEKRQQHTESGQADEGIHPPLQSDEHAAESEKGDDAQSGGKPVNAVYQVDSVQYINDDEHSERHSYIIR